MAKQFTFREKVLMAILGLLIAGLVYYIAVDTPVRNGIRSAETQSEALQVQIAAVQAKLDETQRMEKEIKKRLKEGDQISRMPGYNAENKEVQVLHDTLGNTLDYYIGVDQVTREGDQIRRFFSLQYRADSYQSAIEVMRRLEQSPIRCLIDDVAVNPAGESKSINDGEVQVSCTATFYETMHGGEPDRELPEDSLAEEEET
mgnify:CR=1 FL=1